MNSVKRIKCQTLSLAGQEAEITCGLSDIAVRNDGTAMIYVSADPGIVMGAEGVVSIPAGGSAVVSSPSGKLHITGNGSVLVMATDGPANPFKASAQSGGSGADDVARAAIEAHTGNADIHVSTAEKASWDSKANKSDIPAELPAKGGDADTSKYIGTWGSPEQYYGNQLKARILYNKFSDGRFGLTTDTDNEIRVDHATSADTLNGKHASDFMSYKGYVRDGDCNNATEAGIYTVGANSSNAPGDGYYIMSVEEAGDGAWIRQIASDAGYPFNILVREKINGVWSPQWVNIADGGNAASVGAYTETKIATLEDRITALESKL